MTCMVHPAAVPRSLAEPPTYSLDGAFWSDLQREYWRKKPGCFRQPFREPIAAPQEVMRALHAANQRVAARSLSYKLLVGDRELRARWEEWTPRPEDTSLSAYTERLKPKLGADRFGVFIKDFQLELGWDFWRRMRQFVRQVYGFAGVPSLNAEVDLFVGNYEMTLNGIHIDFADVFYFVTEGTKRMRLWPYEVFRGNPPKMALKDYAQYIPQSTLLEANAGDLLYWPASYWHVAESDGEPASSLSLALYYQHSILSHADRLLTAELSGTRPELFKRPSVAFDDARMPRELEHLCDLVERKPRALRLRERATEMWLKRLTGLGFDAVPPPTRTEEIPPGERLRADPEFPALFKRVHDELILSANGLSLSLPYHPDLPKVLRRVNSGAPFSPEELSLQFVAPSRGRKGPRLSPRALTKLLITLKSYRAIEAV